MRLRSHSRVTIPYKRPATSRCECSRTPLIRMGRNSSAHQLSGAAIRKIEGMSPLRNWCSALRRYREIYNASDRVFLTRSVNAGGSPRVIIATLCVCLWSRGIRWWSLYVRGFRLWYFFDGLSVRFQAHAQHVSDLIGGERVQKSVSYLAAHHQF